MSFTREENVVTFVLKFIRMMNKTSLMVKNGFNVTINDVENGYNNYQDIIRHTLIVKYQTLNRNYNIKVSNINVLGVELKKIKRKSSHSLQNH